MKRYRLFLSLAGLLATGQALAIPLQVSITVDNSYAIFYGTETKATTFVGTDANWQTTETYNFDLPNNQFIYIVTQSDLSTAQGLLAQFTNTQSNYRFYSNDQQWQVAATGKYGSAPYSGGVADLTELESEILKANASSNLSGGWGATTDGEANGAGPWGFRPDIDAAARWVWYDKKNDGSNPTLGGFNHDEYLIFRIAAAASPTNDVPEPASLSLIVAGIAGWSAARRKRA